MLNLTPEQRAALLKLGDPKYESAVIPNDILQELIDLGLVHRRMFDGQLDLTDLGHATLDSLYGRRG